MTAERANKIYDILVTYGAVEYYRPSFVQYVTTEELREWRFQGVFGFGGKVRERNGKVRVDYYQEDKTPVREEALARINQELNSLDISG